MLRRALPWLAACAALLHAATFAAHGPCDDDYIAYRYARNLVEGEGLVFNPGERVEGFSAPGWTLAVAGAIRLGFDPAAFSRVVSIAAMGAAALCVARAWLRGRESDRLAAPAWLVAASPAIGWHAAVGLGTVPLAALLALWIDLWDRAARSGRRATGAAIALGVACLVRNESALFAVCFLVAEARRKRLAAALPCCFPLAAWQAFRLLYYGRWLPNTWGAKKLSLAADLELGLAYLGDANTACGIAVALLLALAAFGRGRDPARLPLRAAMVGLAAHTLFVVYAGGDFFPLARFFVPVLPIALLAACDGFVRLFPARGAIAGAALAAALAFEQLPQWKRGELLDTHLESERRWSAMGRTVAARVPASTRVALAPIGAFGYESRLYVVDMLGLTNSAVAAVEPDPAITIKGHQRHDADWVLAQAPEMIVLGNGWLHAGPDGVPTLVASAWEGALIHHPRFQAEYEPLELAIEGSYPLVFYWRRGVPWPSGAAKP
jgi:hypothetical protein